MYERFINQLEAWHMQYVELLSREPENEEYVHRMLALEVEITTDLLDQNVKSGFSKKSINIFEEVYEFQLNVGRWIKKASDTDLYYLLEESMRREWQDNEML